MLKRFEHPDFTSQLDRIRTFLLSFFVQILRFLQPADFVWYGVVAAQITSIWSELSRCQPFSGRFTSSEHEPSRGKPKRLISMYRCQLCHCVVPPRTPAIHLVVKWRSTEYPSRPKVNTFVQTESNKRKVFHSDDPGGHGQEIVQEVIVCPECAATNQATSESG